jgi:DNA-binding NtrC family response regulator
VRELENVIASATIFAEGAVITPEAFSHVSELHALLVGEPAVKASVPAAPAPEVASAAPAVVAPAAAASPAVAPAAAVDGPLDFYELVRRRDLSLKDLRHEMEMQCIRRALEEAGGNISEAARLLKMKRSRLSQIVNGEGELKEVAHGED